MSHKNSVLVFTDNGNIRLNQSTHLNRQIIASQATLLTLEEALTVIENLEACVRELTTGENRGSVDIIHRVIERKRAIERKRNLFEQNA